MALYGAFTSSILGMMSQSRALNTISTNIANVNTGGYRGTETRFATIYSDTLFEQSDIGGVRTKEVKLMDLQGNMTASSRKLDVAINGKGFFMVSPTLDVDEIYYTRDGSFDVRTGGEVQVTADDGSTITVREGYLVDKNGYYVLGWPRLEDGTIPTTGAPQPMRVDQYTYIDRGQPTSEAMLGLNLPANAAVGETFEYQLDLYDSDGTRRVATARFTATSRDNVWDFDVVTGDAADVVTLGPGRDFALDAGTPIVFGANAAPGDGTGTITIPQSALDSSNLAVGDSITVSGTAGNDRVFTVTGISGGVITVAEDVAAEVDLDGATVASAAALLQYTSMTSVDIDVAAQTITVSSSGLPFAGAFTGLAAGDVITLAGTTGNDGTYTIASVSADGSTITVAAATPLPGPNESDADGTALTAPGALAQRIEFGTDGRVIAPEVYTVGVAWADGATSTVALDLGTTTQFAGDLLVNSYWQNGYGRSGLKSLDFDAAGYVLGMFADATGRPLYRLALASFTNASGLAEHNGNVYSETEISGEPHVFAPGDDSHGLIAPHTRELSNIDIADEFTRMMMTQHAYTASSKVFKTVDEMTEVARDLKG